mgnify:CR=1 FL=1
MFWLWLIVAVLLLGFFVYKLGRYETNEDKAELFCMVFFTSLLWPIVLAVVIVSGPFAGLYFLGDRQREKRKKEESTTNK